MLSGIEVISSSAEVQKFLPGHSYTLAYDGDPELAMAGLDAMVCILPPEAKEWDADVHGGSRHYLVAGEEEELVVIAPRANTLSLVYRDTPSDENAGVISFTRFVNHKAPSPMFQFNVVYRVRHEEESDESKYEKDD